MKNLARYSSSWQDHHGPELTETPFTLNSLEMHDMEILPLWGQRPKDSGFTKTENNLIQEPESEPRVKPDRQTLQDFPFGSARATIKIKNSEFHSYFMFLGVGFLEDFLVDESAFSKKIYNKTICPLVCTKDFIFLETLLLYPIFTN